MSRKVENPDSLQLCVRLDQSSRAMLNELLAGTTISSYLRQLIAIDYGRMLERKDVAKRQAPATVSRAGSK
jgi:hypothetical protein